MLPKTHIAFHTQDAALQKLYDTICERCGRNMQTFAGRSVLVEGGGYEKIWLETQPMGGEMYAGYDMDAALNNQLFFMETQREDGRLAGSIQSFPDGSIEAQFNKFQGFCFAWPALNMYYLMGRDAVYLDQLALCLEKWDQYLWATRDSNGDGILETFCVYDTGEDRAERFEGDPNYCTTDYPLPDCKVLPVASMDIMSFSYTARDTLAEISKIRGDGREQEWRAKAQAVADKIRSALWDDEKGACFDKDKHGNVMPQLIHNNLRCMYWKSFDQEMADRFVSEHLLNPEEFWTKLPLPSVAVNDPYFRNARDNNWSGQCEGLTFQRAIMALENYGYEKIVTQIGHKFIQAAIDGGYHYTQQFDPFTGEPTIVPIPSQQHGEVQGELIIQEAYGPTMLALLEYIGHIWGIDIQMGEVWFSLGSGQRYTYEYAWGEHTYAIDSDGRRAKVMVDGRLRYELPCGIRLITNEEGSIIRTRPIE